MANVSTHIRRARWRLRDGAARYPSVYLRAAFYTDAQTGEWLINPAKEVCIDGYPRSATTFAVAAFQLAQPRPVQMAHHSHAPAQVIAAARWNIPTLVTIREPHDSVLSTAIYSPFLTVRAALESYIRFYRSILPYRQAFVVAEFGDITSRFDHVIARLNDRFACSFAEYRNTPDSDNVVFGVINQGDERSPGNPLVTSFLSGNLSHEQLGTALRRDVGTDLHPDSPAHQSTVARPSSERLKKKTALARAYRADALSSLRDQADGLYDMLTRDGHARAVAAR
jgi:hypothetical protein